MLWVSSPATAPNVGPSDRNGKLQVYCNIDGHNINVIPKEAEPSTRDRSLNTRCQTSVPFTQDQRECTKHNCMNVEAKCKNYGKDEDKDKGNQSREE